MQLKLTPAERQALQAISRRSSISVESLHERLELLTWGDGLLEFRMQSSTGLLPWMEQLSDLSDRVNRRLRKLGILAGPSLEAYEEWLSKQSSQIHKQ
ncbi:MAG: hypothetical protein AAGF98_09730 [Cyanobacteria bacterium P01_H01_bin.153]